jgi:crooked neck
VEKYKKRLDTNPHDYDGWFEWAKLGADNGDTAAVRDVFEQAVSKVPPSEQKDRWRRYVYLLDLLHAIYEELTMNDLARAHRYTTPVLIVIPHKKFSFAKIWMHAAKLYVRRKDLGAAKCWVEPLDFAEKKRSTSSIFPGLSSW